MHLNWRWIFLFFLATCSLAAASNWSKEDYEVSSAVLLQNITPPTVWLYDCRESPRLTTMFCS